MLQRIQSLYLVLSAAALLSVFALPAVATTETWTPTVVQALSALVALACLGAVFTYRDRTKQRQLVTVLQYGALGLIIMVLVILYLFAAPGALDYTAWGYAVLPAVLAYVFLMLARRRIEHDIALVRSMDRLR